MSGILYSLAAVGSQFLVTSVLISITCLASIHLYFYLVRRSKKQEDNEEYILATLQEEISEIEPPEIKDDFSESFSEEDFGTEILTERKKIIPGKTYPVVGKRKKLLCGNCEHTIEI